MTGCWVFWQLVKRALQVVRSPLRTLPGPPPASIVFGNLLQLIKGESRDLFWEWQQTYGHTYGITTLLGTRRGITMDNKAVAHLLSNGAIYHKPDSARFQLSYLLGEGLVTAEGLEHRHQRRTLNPAFNTNQLRNIFPTFLQKSAELRDMLQAQIEPASSSAQIDALQWASRAAIDIIGLAGFNYDFNTIQLGETGNELAAAIRRLNSPKSFPFFLLLKGLIPFLRVFEFDEQSRETRKTRAFMRDIGVNLIAEKERAAGSEKETELKDHDRDLLSHIIKLNMSKSVSAQDKLSMDQMLDQIPTFLVAGHDTTAVSLTWCLFNLAVNKSIQERLRTELQQAFPDDTAIITMETLNSLPYLDAVVREALRYDPPIDFAARVAVQDDVIPLDKPLVQKDGKTVDHIQVKKGDHWLVPIVSMNRSKEIWGEDGELFNPDRWLRDLPPAVTAAPALWSNIMTFLGGPRSCIGYRFAILEMKSLLLYLVRTLEFELAVDPKDVMHKTMIVTRPFLRSDPKEPRLPMIIRPVSV
ncbi:cytochrome P450 [Serendipita vermifera]|nr:cytochrome P450 [Serendipita vermifera]